MRKKKDLKSQPKLPQIDPYPPDLQPIADRFLKGYAFDVALKTGKTRATYRIKDVLTGQHYCLKTIKPDITDLAQRQHVYSTLRKECEILLPLCHNCLPKIYQHRAYGDTYFYVCTYHPGDTFHDFREAKHRLDQVESTFVVRSLMDVLRLVHAKGRQHCDLHGGNVLIDEAVLQHGILVIDFGSGHRDSDSSPETEFRGNINFKADSKKPRQNFRGARADAAFEVADFRGLGELLIEMQECFFAYSNALVRHAYMEFARALYDRKLRSWDDAERAFKAVIDPLHVISDNTDLFLSADGRPLDIPLPVVQNVPVGNPSLNVINTERFQRLRNIRQLSFCDLSFPGAVHTRFEHSLGVFANAKRAVDHLVYDKQFRDSTSSDEVRGFLLASLVHDVGHYPFAHPVEQYATSRLWRSKECKEDADHANESYRLLKNDAEFRNAVVSSFGRQALEYALTFFEKGTRTKPLHTLLNGPIDVDKIDYLRRDAHHSGASRGTGLNIDTLFQNLAVVRNGEEIGVTERAVGVVEQLMVLQDEMLASVYWHPVVRGAICMFHLVLAHIVEDDNPELFRQIVAKLKKTRSEHEAIQQVIEPACAVAANRLPKSGKKDNRSPDLAKRLGELIRFASDSNYESVYKSLAEHPRTERTGKVPSTIYRALVVNPSHTGDDSDDYSVPIDWPLVKSLRAHYLRALKEKGAEADYLDVVVDVPYGKASRSMVHVLVTSTGEEEQITSVSNLANSIFSQPAAFASPVRAFMSPRVVQQLSTSRLREAALVAEDRFLTGRQAAKEKPAL